MSANDRLFSPTEVDEYLQRIGLQRDQLDSLSKLEALRKIQLAHLLTVPFDTTAVHLPLDWWSDEHSQTPIVIGKDSPFQPELVSVDCDDTLRNIVKNRRGGYCWSLNSCFARLLLTLGYHVLKLPARVYTPRTQNPAQVGYEWTPICHLCLLVDVDNTQFLCDVGFGGGGPPYPIPFVMDQEASSLGPVEKFRLVRQICPELNSEGQLPGYTLERWVGEWWSPCYHFYDAPMTFRDVEVYNWYNSTHSLAVFKTLMVVTLVLKDDSRRTLLCHVKDDKQGELKISTTAHPRAEETDVSYITPTFGELRRVLRQEFNWGPP
ncbi:hypothetical protein O181_045411 [Austropuccinia psidii MF-1]|uniref:Arylamine N-acetyltransferase n=1 Tax=Austropuccinia psidii MF-1 TaxID=1389203 RepID=A0A9Q3DK69_9BASI|nr:hypothetical protein [Austropuccinia psidii MF-1]